MQATAYFANATRVVHDHFMIGTNNQRNNKYMLSGKTYNIECEFFYTFFIGTDI